MKLSGTRIIGGLPFAAFGVFLLVFLSSGSPLAAQDTHAKVGGGLDCNGFSPISKNVKPYMACTDLHGANGGRFYDNGWYIGHDEPTIQFFSNTPKSGYDLAWVITLPEQDPTPTQSGSSTSVSTIAYR